MTDFSSNAFESPYKGSGNLTREQFYFFEVRTAATMILDGLTEDQIAKIIVSDNLFQYPTERTIKRAISACLARLHALNDETLVKAIAERDYSTAKQICLYAMMQQYRLVRDFMITVIGEKYRAQDFWFSRSDINAFLMRLQEQDDTVASWSDETIKKIGSVISRVLIETEYIDNAKATRLNPVLISSILENSLRSNGETKALAAFNCLS